MKTLVLTVCLMLLAMPAIAQDEQPETPPAEPATEPDDTSAPTDEPTEPDVEAVEAPTEEAPPTDTVEETEVDPVEAELDSMSLYDDEEPEPEKKKEEGGFVDTFGSSLATLGIQTTISGYGAVVLDVPFGEDEVFTFDQTHINPIISAFIGQMWFTELELEYEHGGDEIAMEYALLDALVAEQFVVRAGKFIIPMGQFNEFYHPSFRNQMVSRPFAIEEIVPGTYADVGLQLYGAIRLAPAFRLQYAAYVVNGLEQTDPDLEDDIVPEGGDITDMRGNVIDEHNPDKAFGGRLGGKVFAKDLEVTFGASAYTGAYTVDGQRRLNIFVGDLAASYRGFTFRSEGVLALQEVEGGSLHKHGAFGQVGYKFKLGLEPVLRYDYIRLPGETRHRVAAVLAYYFLESVALRNEFSGTNVLNTSTVDYMESLQLSFAF